MVAIARGLEQKHEQDPRRLLRDTRTLSQRFVDFFKNPQAVTILLVGFASGAFFIPAIADLIFLLGILSFFYAYTRKTSLPFRMPQRSHQLDHNDLKAGTNKPQKARGICLFGNEISSGEELWFSNDDMRTHCLIFGSTGSGKTEALISLAFNALVQGSGFIYVDGKGDNSLFAKVFSMARSMGREDDILVVNFMTGARDIVGPQEKRLSNTMNPFANGSSSMLSQLVVSLMDASSNTPDGDMWKGRAIVFVEALMKLLVYIRDQGGILLDVNVVRNYFELTRVENIVIDKIFPRDGQEPLSLIDVPEVVLEPITNYLINLPGYDKSKKGKQVSQVLEQHGFITMQLTRVFGSLADTYGHILRTNLAEVDLKDVVLNRRILLVLLPAFEKSPDELSNLGKVIIASLKAMLAAGLGEEVEGDYRDIIERKPTNSLTPYLCVLDEYGYYAVPGFAVVPAQARSLGFSIVFAGQDLPAFQKASKEEAASIGANCNIKLCMKLEDPLETWDFFSKSAGEAWVTKVDAFQTRAESVMNNYADTRSASSEKRARIDLLDLKEQREGEAHILFKSKIIRARLFYANPRPVARMRLNQFLKVGLPTNRYLLDLQSRLQNFRKVTDKAQFSLTKLDESTIITRLAQTLSEHPELNPIKAAVPALLVLDQPIEASKEETVIETEETLPDNELNVFTPLTVTPQLASLMTVDNPDQFNAAFLKRSITQKLVAVIEKVSGKFEKHANSIAAEIVQDMALATHYPPALHPILPGAELAKDVNKLLLAIKKERVSREEKSDA
ncbi:phosphoesterase [Candidatus Rickettsiella isopodorum]|jgi:intracellular multiplication protein IcmO|uniref:Phosphoesterase n=1 Tax=Candidatus Rickettsiella isopodorum TaxID=1225476 RepID=A0A1J8NM30_9COXI|nr:phosphoesterase [Candidatus Rickettsiella isopodorum]